MKRAMYRSLVITAVAAILGTSAFAQKFDNPNVTFGYGGRQLLKFFYTQNFDCVEEPTADLNFNGIAAASDPAELQTPICEVGTVPNINPPGQIGNPGVTTAPLYVLVPMFSTDNDQNPNDAITCDKVVAGTTCGAALGNTLIQIFGALPEAFKAKPAVYTQCPEPGSAPGTCTMHASRLDLAPVLAELGITGPATANIFVPTPNHSHVLKTTDTNLKAIWWQVIPVLVMKQSDWPTKDATHGITSVDAITGAIKAGRAVKAPSNFFLFFASTSNVSSADDMANMKME